MICIAIDNGSDNTVGGSCYSAHQAVRKFAEHRIDMVSCGHRKCLSRAGVSRDISRSGVVVVVHLGLFPAKRWPTTVCAHLNCARHR